MTRDPKVSPSAAFSSVADWKNEYQRNGSLPGYECIASFVVGSSSVEDPQNAVAIMKKVETRTVNGRLALAV